MADNICKSYICEWLISKIYKEFIQFDSKKKNMQSMGKHRCLPTQVAIIQNMRWVIRMMMMIISTPLVEHFMT